jgi:hypothetical protein
MRIITPLLLLLLSGLLFAGYIDSTYTHIRELQNRVSEYDRALTRSKELIAVRDELISRRNTFGETERRRLAKMLPDNVDNVRLIMDIDNIAARYGMSLQNVEIGSQGSSVTDSGGIGPDGNPIGSIELGFSVSAPYDDFIALLKDLEQSLRIVDVHSISFVAGSSDFNQYIVGIRTYWLK